MQHAMMQEQSWHPASAFCRLALPRLCIPAFLRCCIPGFSL